MAATSHTAATAPEVRALRSTITLIDALAQDELDQIATIAGLALQSIETPHMRVDLVAAALRMIVSRANEAAGEIENMASEHYLADAITDEAASEKAAHA